MNKPRFLNVWLFFAAVYLVSGVLFLPVVVSDRGMSTPLNTALVALAAFVPSVMGVLFTSLTKGPEERRDFWRRAFCWPRGRTKLAIAGLLILPAIVVTSYLVSALLSGAQIALGYAVEVLTNWKSLILYLFVELTFGALSEELGWRGYALDELQARWGALPSSLVLGFVWAFWHTPGFLIPGLSQNAMGGIGSPVFIAFMLSVPLGSILHTWIYNNTGRSILVAGFLMHFTQNATLILLGGIFDRFAMPPAYWTVVLVVTAAAAVLVVLLYGPRALTREPTNGAQIVQPKLPNV